MPLFLFGLFGAARPYPYDKKEHTEPCGDSSQMGGIGYGNVYDKIDTT